MSAIRKAGVTFYPGVGVSPDLTGLADTLSLKYKKRGDSSFTSSANSFTEENTGTYTTPLTLNSTGDYIVIIESTDPRIENLEGNVLVTAASIDDVNNAVQTLQNDITSIKSQIDVLDETELNNIKEQIDELGGVLGEVKNLIDNKNPTGLKINGDVRSEIEIGDIINDRDDSGSGTIIDIYFDGNDTWVRFEGHGSYDDGSWTPGDVIEVRNKPNLSGTVGAPYDNSLDPVDSVMEFVEDINRALSTGASSLSVLSRFTDNIEYMLEGKEYIDTDGIIVSEADSKGLREIFDAIDNSGGDTTYIKGRVEDLVININNYYSEIQNEQVVIKGRINDVVIPGLDAVQTVVDANKAHLENSGYGLSAIKNLLDSIDSSIGNIQTDNSDVLLVLNDANNGLSAIKNSILNKLDSMDGKLDTLVAATTSRIFV